MLMWETGGEGTYRKSVLSVSVFYKPKIALKNCLLVLQKSNTNVSSKMFWIKR